MTLWKTRSLSSGEKIHEIDIRQLILRLQSIVNKGNMEVAQLAIQSMLEELKEKEVS